jgi:hypothetical protein
VLYQSESPLLVAVPPIAAAAIETAAISTTAPTTAGMVPDCSERSDF